MKKLRKDNLELLAVIVFIFAATFVLLLKSPLNFWLRGDAETDSSVYKTVAFMMNKGYMPYRDSFDHKGPLTYLVNLLGMQFDEYCGVWIMEFITVFATFAGIYKIARLRCNKIFSCLCILICGSLLYDYFEGGNMVEEYAMPFIAVSLYIFLDYFLNLKISKLRLAVCGGCLGAVFLLRPNMISVWMVFAIAVLIDCIIKKKNADLLKFIVFFLIGFVVVTLPVFIWLAANGCFGAFIENYIQFNVVYSSAKGAGDKWNAYFYFINKTLIIFALLIMGYICSIKCEFIAKDKTAIKDKFTIDTGFLYVTYLIYLLVTILLIAMSGMPYAHYGMILVPAIAFPMAELFALTGLKNNGNATTLLIILYMVGAIAMPKWLTTSGDMVNKYNDRAVDHHSDMVKGVCELVGENTNEDERISVYGNGDIIYLVSNRLHATRYSYQFPIGEIAPAMMDEYFEELENELPPVIVIWERQADERIESFLNENNYTEISDSSSYDIGKSRVFLISRRNFG
ncbi:MAG: hypothetical protein J1E98_06320 [Lachnospiraceae bacterium]|nr:hypothetical protein [Lachnospiraceae bacterium]